MGKPIGEITHWRNKNVENLPKQLEYTNPCPWRNPYKGNHKGGRPKAAPPLWRRPKAASFIWVSPWARVRVFGLPGQVFHIFIAPTCDFAYGFPHGPGHYRIELPLGTIACCLAGLMSMARGLAGHMDLMYIDSLMVGGYMVPQIELAM